MLYYNPENTLLHESLSKLMAVEEFLEFRLCGVTILSLQIVIANQWASIYLQGGRHH